MAILPIITLPDPLLRKISEPVDRVDAEVRRLLDDMLETMYEAPGVGLAAIQVGRSPSASSSSTRARPRRRVRRSSSSTPKSSGRRRS